MKKIMWLCNTPLPEVRGELGIKVCGEGWLQGISDQLRGREDIELHYVFPQNKTTKLYKKVTDIFFWGFYSDVGNAYDFSEKRKLCIAKIIREIKPDIIHIFGTESAHSLECIQVVPSGITIVLSVQGLVSELRKIYTKKIPIYDRYVRTDNFKSIEESKYEFYRRGINEVKILKNVSNIIGRTAWDKRCVKRINPKCQYLYCNETLRETFYDGKWDIDKIRRHSIYISQAYYPIKGFHIFLKALSKIVQNYSDVHVYVAGNRSFMQSGDTYGRYIQKLIKKYKLKEYIVFLGTLSAEEVKETLLHMHITVMPSLLENSPNSMGEALQLGTPIVAAKVGGIPSLVRDEKEALLYTGHSAKRMASCIRRIFAEDNLALRLSINGRKRAAKLYNRAANLEELLKIYEVSEEK